MPHFANDKKRTRIHSPSDIKKRRQAYRRGLFSEILGIIFLTFKGYKVIAWRKKTRAGEIDIIAKRRNIIAIIEVKYRHRHKEALQAVTFSGQKKIANAARVWLSQNRRFENSVVRFDIITFAKWQWPQHYLSAFEDWQ